jgi:imidazolonepropionase-like amidohydrolase
MNCLYSFKKLIFLTFLLGLLSPLAGISQDEKELAPVTKTYAIIDVNITQAPGRKLEHGTILIKDGLIFSVGKDIVIPAEANIIKGDSLFVYAGFIDGLSHAGVIHPKEEQRERLKDPGNPPPEKAGITPQTDVRNWLNPNDRSLEDLRALGFTTAQVVPYGVFLPGNAAIILLSGTSADKMVLVSNSSFYAELSSYPGAYPTTVIGIMAKWRELYQQASLAKSYEAVYASNRSGLERPSTSRVLQAFYPVIEKKEPVLFKAEKMLEAYRVLALQNDLGFPLILGNLKEGWEIITKIKGSGAKVFLSLDLPEEKKDENKSNAKKDGKKEIEKEDAKKSDSLVKANPKVKTATDLEKEALEKRKSDVIAKYVGQALVYQQAGISFGFSTLNGKTREIPANFRRIIKSGLTEDQLLAALTTTPAQLLGLSDRLGTIDNGKIANLVITNGPYFQEKSKVQYLFVDGELFKIDVKESKKDSNSKIDLTGSWSFVTETRQGKTENKISFKKDNDSYTGIISGGRLSQSTDLKNVDLDGTTLKFGYTQQQGTNPVDVTVEGVITGDSFKGTSTIGQLGSFSTEGSKDPKHK